jgi:hypothetical protein
MIDDLRMLTVEDVMAHMQWRDRDTVYKHVHRGRLQPIPGVRPMRFTIAAFEAFVAGTRQQTMGIAPPSSSLCPSTVPYADAPQTTPRGSRYGRIGK